MKNIFNTHCEYIMSKQNDEGKNMGMSSILNNLKPQGSSGHVMIDKGQSLAKFVGARDAEQKIAGIEFRDRSGNVVKASEIFPMQSHFNQTVFAPHGGIHSLK